MLRNTRPKQTGVSGLYWTLSLQGSDQIRKHLLRLVPIVVAKLKLLQILPKILLRNMNMCATNRQLQPGPKAFDAVDMRTTTYPLASTMIHSLMAISDLVQSLVRAKFIRVYRAARFNVLLNDGLQRFLFNVRDDLGHKIAVPVQHTKGNALVRGATATLPARDLATDLSLINLNISIKRIFTVSIRHVPTYFMSHSQSSWIGNSKLSLKFQGWHSVPCSSKQINSIKPLLQRNMRASKDSLAHWIDRMPTPRTLISRITLDAMKLPMLSTFRAVHGIAMLFAHQVIQTSIVVWKLLHKLLNCRGYHGVSPTVRDRLP